MKAAWATQRILDQGGQFHENLSENLGKSTDSYITRQLLLTGDSYVIRC